LDIHCGGGEKPRGRRKAEQKKPKAYELHLHASTCTSAVVCAPQRSDAIYLGFWWVLACHKG
jgi:hypothetical protein